MHLSSLVIGHRYVDNTCDSQHSVAKIFFSPEIEKETRDRYGDSVDNTVDNSSVFSLIQMRWACRQLNFAPTKSSSS